MMGAADTRRQLEGKKILAVLRAFRKGDFSIRLPLDLTGIDGEIASELNSIIELTQEMGDELSRSARLVGQEGKMEHRSVVPSAKGEWLTFTDSFNLLSENMAQPIREVGQVITSVAKGDLLQKMPEMIDDRPLKGEFARIAGIINAMVNQLGTFASEVTRVAQEVGTYGQLGGQTKLKGVSGIWKDLSDSVNFMAKNLTDQVRNIAEVTTAVATGDLSKKITVQASGEIEDLKNTINVMVDQLNGFASEVTRVAREVGTEGILGGQAKVEGADGIWKDLTENVNSMANNLTEQVRSIAEVTTAVARGDLSRKITVEAKGEILELRNTINTMVNQLNAFASEVTRVAREVGTEGILGGQAEVQDVAGIWRVLTNNVNSMAKNLTDQVRNIAEVTIAVANGDLSKKITVDAKGEILELKDTINTMVQQLNSFSSEVTRVAREVGTEGKLGTQAKVEDVAGIWKDLTENVNSMADNLTLQVRSIAEVTTSVANGDLSKKIDVEASGEILELKKTINIMVDQLNSFASEVTRVAREVGTEGILGGQAKVEGVSGTWKELTKSVNSMADNLTSQVRNIAEVATSVAKGDLSKSITVQAKGEIQELKDTINLMVALLSNFSSEVTRVARQVGAEGKLGGQASVEGVSGIWKDLTDNVNFMAKNLTEQVRGIAEVTTAVAVGDLSRKITVEASGEIQDLKNTINTMVDQLNAFGSEVARVAREVGQEGKLGGMAKVEGVSGIWKDLTDNVNFMADNLTNQVRNIAEVTKAVAFGDLSRKITVEARGEILELGNTINIMVDQLNAFSSEVTRVAREVGTEGVLGGQAKVEGVAGVWQELTNNVNSMANNLTGQVRNIAEVTTAVANGDLSLKITVEVKGEILELKNTINTMVDQLNAFSSEVTRVAREVGADGKLGGQAEVPGVSGIWKDLTENVNFMANNLTEQVRGIAEVTTAVANGDLSKKIAVKARGEILELTNTINKMVEQLNSFASEVTRVAREVGTEGVLGGQASVTGVAGTWKDLTDNVNTMAMNLTNQVRGIAQVVTSVANGDLKRKLQIDARGEIETLTNTINSMIDTLATFADQVTFVAREVGVEGKLGGQANVPGAAGIWKDLTENVNQLANNLTTQVRAIAEVATAVTQGDLSRSISVEAQGEVSELKDNINEMISNLKSTTQKNQEQDWLKTNIARFTGMMQGQRDITAAAQLILSELAPLVEAQHGVFYIGENTEEKALFKLISSYAYKDRKFLAHQFQLGEGLVGQAALEKKRITVHNVPDDYVKINSGLGEATPYNLVILPVVFEEQVKAVIELATFHRFKDIHNQFLDQLSESIGIVLETISATMRTEQLLTQSQNMAKELQAQQEELRESNEKLEQQADTLKQSEIRLKEQQEELQQTNEELTEKAKMLQVQNKEVERKNYEIELAKQSIEEKAEQLNLSNKYKSEFLANMSHELRTPLNSIMLLSEMFRKGELGKLDIEQIKQMGIINEAGKELLQLINEVLDLSKIEAGKMDIRIGDVVLHQLAQHIKKMFISQVRDKGLEFKVEIDDNVPDVIQSDGERVQQVIRNFISNSLKFSEEGEIIFRIHPLDDQTIQHVVSYWVLDERLSKHSHEFVVFSVTDFGMGISRENQIIIFEAFQQLDGSIRRRFGGTGLGLSICKGIADTLGGAIALRSQENKGATFSLILPVHMKEEHLPQSFHFGGPSVPSNGILAAKPIASDAKPVLTPKPVESPVSEHDDRESIFSEDDKIILIVEDDMTFSQILKDLAHRRGYKVLHAITGTEAIRLATEFIPTGVLLDIQLPIIDGWEVLRNLKQNPATRHIPVHILSVVPDETFGYKLGAVGYLVKPISEDQLSEAFSRIEALQSMEVKTILLVEDNDLERENILKVIEDKDVKVTAVSTGKEALTLLETGKFDAFILDLRLPDINGFEILKIIHHSDAITHIPTIVYTAKELSIEEERELRKYSESIILKTADSHARLLEETTLFLHRIEANLDQEKRDLLATIAYPDSIFQGKTIMLVDDDIRTTYTLTTALENRDLIVLTASDGEEALKVLNAHPEIDLILMDVMMPVLDGIEATARIRSQEKFRDLPIIAVTAKAMKEDRTKCLDAGASDFISKPVDYDQLFSLIRVWLSAPRASKASETEKSKKSKPAAKSSTKKSKTDSKSTAKKSKEDTGKKKHKK